MVKILKSQRIIQDFECAYLTNKLVHLICQTITQENRRDRWERESSHLSGAMVDNEHYASVCRIFEEACKLFKVSARGTEGLLGVILKIKDEIFGVKNLNSSSSVLGEVLVGQALDNLVQ